jgi:copper chaperone CopZ
MTDNNPNVVVRLRVEGMRCHSCEEKLTAWLSDIRGVKSVEASSADSLVTIEATEDVAIDDMLKAIVHAGFIPGAPVVVDGYTLEAVVEMPIEAERSDDAIAKALAEAVAAVAIAGPAQLALNVGVARTEPQPSPSPSPCGSPWPCPRPRPRPSGLSPRSPTAGRPRAIGA